MDEEWVEGWDITEANGRKMWIAREDCCNQLIDHLRRFVLKRKSGKTTITARRRTRSSTEKMGIDDRYL